MSGLSLYFIEEGPTDPLLRAQRVHWKGKGAPGHVSHPGVSEPALQAQRSKEKPAEGVELPAGVEVPEASKALAKAQQVVVIRISLGTFRADPSASTASKFVLQND